MLLFLITVFSIYAEPEYRGFIVKYRDGTVKLKKEITGQSINENIEYIEPNYILRKVALPKLEPNDPKYNLQWALRKIRAPESWYELQFRSGDTVYIAVLDTGVDFNHPDLRGKVWLNTGETLGRDNNGNGLDDGCENSVDDDGNGYVDDCYGWDAIRLKGSAADKDGHGTHIAGIISALTDNGIGVAGVSWNVDIKIIPCRMMDSKGEGTVLDEIHCFEYIKSLKQDKGLNILVLNASYGGEYTSNAERDGITDLGNRGILFITASGNDFRNNEISTFSPCNYDLSNEVCVGGTNQNDEVAYFSNYGKRKVKIFAPGKEIVSTYKDNNYASIDGTSQSTPFVSAVAGILGYLNPGWSVYKIRDRLMLSGENLESLYGYSYTCNRLDMYEALFENKTPAKVCFDVGSVDFGSAEIGGEKRKTVTLRNTGEDTLRVYSINSIEDVFKIRDNDCSGEELKSFEECTFDIVFKPDRKDEFQSYIVVETNVGDKKIRVSGRVFYSPEIVELYAEPDNPDVDQTVTIHWEIVDEDSDNLTCYIDKDGDGDIDKTINNCPKNGVYFVSYDDKKTYTFVLKVTDGSGMDRKSIKIKVGNGDGTSLSCRLSGKVDGSVFLLALFLFMVVLRKRKLP